MNMMSISSRALDSGVICRFCLSEDGKFVSIFKEEDLRDEDERPPVASRIMSIAPVEVRYFCIRLFFEHRLALALFVWHFIRANFP